MAQATSSSTDPVQTIIDLLDGTPEADWPSGTKPTHIETRWDTPHEEKHNREGPVVYCWSPDDGTREHLSVEATVKDVRETVFAECWAGDQAKAQAAASDVQTILEQYWKDNQRKTKWRHIRPLGEDDRRAEHVPDSRAPFVVAIRIALRTEGTITSPGGL